MGESLTPRRLPISPVSKDDIALATRAIVRSGSVSAITLQMQLKMSPSKARKIIALLQGAGVVTPATETAPAQVVFKNEAQAVNMALRRFNKGKRGK